MNGTTNRTDVADNSNVPPTQDILMAEVRYGIVFGEMNEVFNSHLHRLLTFFSISSGLLTGTSVLPIIGKISSEVVLPWTLTFAVIAALAFAAQKAFKFSEKAEKFRKAKAAFQALEGTGWDMSRNDLQKEIAKLRKNAPSEGAWLAPLAYNRACVELGHSEVQIPVSTPAKFVWSVTAWA